MWHPFGWHFWGMHFFWWIFWIVLIAWIIIIYRRNTVKKENDSALDILRKRFAKGEISKEEFEEKKKVLENN